MAVIRSLMVKVGVDLSNFEKGLKQAQKALNKIGKNLQKAGEFMTKNVTAPILATGTALVAMTLTAAKAADDLLDLSIITGISAEKLQEMSIAGGMIGTNLDTMTIAQTRLTRSVYEALNGNKELIKAFQTLGITLYDNNGNLKDANTLFWEALEALGKIEDPVLRDGLAMELMGKSARELNPLIKAGKENFDALTESLRSLGIILSSEDLQTLADLNDKMDILKAGAAALASKIALELEPTITKWVDKAIEQIPKISQKIEELGDWWNSLNDTQKKAIGTIIGIGVAGGPVLLALAAVVNAVKSIIGVIGPATAAGTLLFYLGLAALALFSLYEAFTKGPEQQTWLARTLDKLQELTTITNGKIKQALDDWTKWWDDLFKGIAAGLDSAIKWVGDLIKIIGELMGFGETVTVPTVVDPEKQGAPYNPNYTPPSLPGLPGINIKVPPPVPVDKAKESQTWLGRILDNLNINIPGFAEGGILTAPRIVLAGEAGPEAILPLSKLKDFRGTNIIQVVLDGRVIQEYVDNGLGNGLAAFGGSI